MQTRTMQTASYLNELYIYFSLIYSVLMLLSLAVKFIGDVYLHECLCHWHTHAICKKICNKTCTICKTTTIYSAVSAGNTTSQNVRHVPLQMHTYIYRHTSCENIIIMFDPINRNKSQHNNTDCLIIFNRSKPSPNN